MALLNSKKSQNHHSAQTAATKSRHSFLAMGLGSPSVSSAAFNPTIRPGIPMANGNPNGPGPLGFVAAALVNHRA